MSHLPKRLRPNPIKQRYRYPCFIGLDNLVPLSSWVKLKKRRKWSKPYSKYHIKERQNVTGSIGGRSRDNDLFNNPAYIDRLMSNEKLRLERAFWSNDYCKKQNTETAKGFFSAPSMKDTLHFETHPLVFDMEFNVGHIEPYTAMDMSNGDDRTVVVRTNDPRP